jgi:hypothetical protein
LRSIIELLFVGTSLPGNSKVSPSTKKLRIIHQTTALEFIVSTQVPIIMMGCSFSFYCFFLFTFITIDTFCNLFRHMIKLIHKLAYKISRFIFNTTGFRHKDYLKILPVDFCYSPIFSYLLLFNDLFLGKRIFTKE